MNILEDLQLIMINIFYFNKYIYIKIKKKYIYYGKTI